MRRPDIAVLAFLRRHAGEAVRDGSAAAGRLRAGLAAGLWPPRPRHAAAALALAIAAAGLLGLSFQGSLPGRLPGDLDWRAAAAVLERDARPGDAVALSPWWAERARLVLPAWLPVMALPRYPGEPLWGVRRVWLLSLPDAPGAGGQVARDLAARSSGGEPPQRLGALELSRHDLAEPALPVAFLPDLLAGAEVRQGDAPCPAAGGAFRCGPGGAAREVREVDGRPRPCIAIATGAGAELSIALRALPPGRVVRGHAGLVSPAAGGRAVRITVRAGSGEAALLLDGPGWRAFELPSGGAREVTIAARSPDGPGLACVEAALLP